MQRKWLVLVFVATGTWLVYMLIFNYRPIAVRKDARKENIFLKAAPANLRSRHRWGKSQNYSKKIQDQLMSKADGIENITAGFQDYISHFFKRKVPGVSVESKFHVPTPSNNSKVVGKNFNGNSHVQREPKTPYKSNKKSSPWYDMKLTNQKKVNITTQPATRTQKLKASHYVSINFQGRLGNLMFQYASLYGIAKQNGLLPAVHNSLHLNQIFNVSAKKFNKFPFQFLRTFQEKKGCTFEEKAHSLGDNENVLLDGYFQSWKYFKNAETDLRREFHFKESTRQEAQFQFNRLVVTGSLPTRERNIVGVHVRRGDMLGKFLSDYGYISADLQYLQHAMIYFRNNYRNVLFIVSTDDYEWCQNNLEADDVRFIGKKNSAEVDMAILTQANHTIMTQGSFGWWIAWLTGGETVYYSHYPKPGTKLDAQFTKTDYYPPDWIPMD